MSVAQVLISAAFAWGLIAGDKKPDQRLTILAVGDLNLGRHVGQMLLLDSLDYPFVFAAPVLKRYDIVFGNLESQITDQNGETQHPRDRYIFCAPPQAARSLKLAGFSVVATANNHAYDYKMTGLRETIEYLEKEGLKWTGTSLDSVRVFPPAVVQKNGMRVGFLAYTQFVNRKTGWAGHIALFEKKRVQRELELLRPSADFILVSFHGGDEYAEKPNPRTVADMRSLIDAGADIVVGHHPHVPQGVEQYKGKWIFYSLGNFVFYQPQREWTQRGIALAITLRRSAGAVEVEQCEIFPLKTGFQPSFSVSSQDLQLVGKRLQALSQVPTIRKDTSFVLSQFAQDLH